MKNFISPPAIKEISIDDISIGDTILRWLDRIPKSSRISLNADRYVVKSISTDSKNVIITTTRNIKLSILKGSSVYILS